jgi:Holliday junction resolvase
MERRITEEQATIGIIDWLEANSWKIICFDFPQSGTGVSLHPNEELRTTKNKGAFIPDIVAIKNGTVIFFENKDRFVLDDFVKIHDLRNNNDYSSSIQRLLSKFEYSEILYGVGLVHSDSTEVKTNKHLDKIDFSVFYHRNKTIKIQYDPKNLFK